MTTSLYVMKCPGDRKDTLNKCSTVYSLYVNITNCPGDLKDINVLLHYKNYLIHRVDIYMSLRSPGHFIPWRTLIFLSIFRTTI